MATNSRRRTSDRRVAESRIPELRTLAAPLIELSKDRRSAPLLYLELTGVDRVPIRQRPAALAACKRAVAAALLDSIGTVLRRNDAVAAGPGARWFVALLVDRAVAAPARATVSDADLGLVAGRLAASVRARLRPPERSVLQFQEIGVIAGWSVLDPVSQDKPIEELRQAVRGAAVVASVEAQRALVLAAVTHELRTPLTSIIGYAERLRGDAELSRARRERYTGIVADEARRLHRLVESLIDIGAWSAGKLRLSRRSVTLRDLVQRAWASVAARAQVKSLRFELRGTAEGMVDVERIEQVLINLLDNAVRHSPTGGCVSVTLARTKGACRLTVSDEGRGFDVRTARCAGTPFAPGPDGRTGLGLSIARLLVEAHGGSLSIGRARRRGARLEISLPVSPT